MQHLYFLRHGIAEDGGPDLPDAERQLTGEGRDKMQIAARVIAALGIDPVRIYSSPRKRALQTAEIVAAALGKDVTIDTAVDFSFDVMAAHDLRAGLPDKSDIMYVGHNPSMSEVVSQMTGAAVSMKKGGLARVDVYPGEARGELVYLLTPKVFAALE